MWPQRPLRGSPGMVGVTLVCGLRDPCAAVLGWWELLLCVSPGMVGVTVVCGLRDLCAAVCGVWPQRPLCGSPGMVGVTVVCGLRYQRVTVLGWCILFKAHVFKGRLQQVYIHTCVFVCPGIVSVTY